MTKIFALFLAFATTGSSSFAHAKDTSVTEKSESAFHEFLFLRETANRKQDFSAYQKEAASGGWNGNGGGGGSACFQDENTANAAKNQNGFVRIEALDQMVSFKTGDLTDMMTEPDWSAGENFDPVNFIHEKIEKHLSPVNPRMAKYVEAVFDSIQQTQWPLTEDFQSFNDTGLRTSATKLDRRCGYIQWVMRPENTAAANPQFVLVLNGPLDRRLKQILSPREYRIQRATLALHEALYSLLARHGAKSSTTVRYLMDFILMPDADFDRYIITKEFNGGFWNLFWRSALPLLGEVEANYADWANMSKSDTAFSDYQKFLQHLISTYNFFVYLLEHGKARPVHIEMASQPGTAEYGRTTRVITYMMFAQDKTVLDHALHATDADAAYLLAADLSAMKMAPRLADLAVAPLHGVEWHTVCDRFAGVMPIYQNSVESTPDKTEAQLLQWQIQVAQRALNFCKTRVVNEK